MFMVLSGFPCRIIFFWRCQSMTFLEVVQTDWFCMVSCLALCLFHLVYEIVHGRKLGKKITALCTHCGLPIYDELSHKCTLSESQLSALTEFIVRLRGDENAG